MKFLLVSFLWLAAIAAQAQQIFWINPSFEDPDGAGQAPSGWNGCEVIFNSPPDIQPGHFDCTLRASDGKTYVGMVIRDDLSWEGISQKMSVPLDSGQWYGFSVDLAKSKYYTSLSKVERVIDKKTGERSVQPSSRPVLLNYNDDAVFQLWGGYSECDMLVLLSETGPVSHLDWKRYQIGYRHDLPKPLTHLVLQAYFTEEDRCVWAHGNLLMDNLTPIQKMQGEVMPGFSRSKMPEPHRLPLIEKMEIDSVLRAAFSGLEISDREPHLKFKCRTDRTGIMYQENYDLDFILEAARQHPGLRIQIHVYHKHRKSLPPYFIGYFEQHNVPKGQIEVTTKGLGEGRKAKFDSEFIAVFWELE